MNFHKNKISKNSGCIETSIQEFMISNNKTVFIAESCTGGNISKCLTRLPGSSKYFLGAVIAYSNYVKTKILGVKEERLNNFGAVSEEIAVDMVDGIFSIVDVNFAIAITGIAGPSGAVPGKPVGTVWFCVGYKGFDYYTCKLNIDGDRETIVEMASHSVLSSFFEKISDMKNKNLL